MRHFIQLLGTLSIVGAMHSHAAKMDYWVTSPEHVRADLSAQVTRNTTAGVDFTIDLTAQNQRMKGFGGAFNEQGWAALSALAAPERDAVMQAIFSPTEGNFAWGRVPIGASDYALSRYTLAPVADDFAMEHFTLERDQQYLIPYLKAAKAVRPNLKLWGSAWTPPVWMKDNGAYEGGHFIDQPKYYQAYAQYLAKFIEGYGQNGLEISAVAVQNEPTIVTGYPNGGWTPQQFLKFIRDYAGPLFAEKNLSGRLWLGTFNEGKYNTYVQTVLDDPLAKRYVSAVGLQWDGDQQIDAIKIHHPDISIIQTETDCGNWHWKPGFDRNHAQNDFQYAAYTWGRIRDYLAAGAEAYMLWNIVLDQDGKNIDKTLPWPQNSGIVINTQTKQVSYTPMFRAFEHFSRYVPEGAVMLSSKGMMRDVLAFKTKQGRIIVELMNSSSTPQTVTGQIGKHRYSLPMPAQSFATLIVP